MGFLGCLGFSTFHPPSTHKKENVMFKMSDLCTLLAVTVAFVVTAYLWFNGQKEEGLFTATWVPSILSFGIYFKVLSLKGQPSE